MAGIFISHIAEDRYAATALKDLILEAFGKELAVFVASDYESIRSGDDWHGRILDALKMSVVVLVLCHAESFKRPWINYEAGVGDGQGSLVIPCALRQFKKADLKPPLSRKQTRDLMDSADLNALLRDIGTHLKQRVREVDFRMFLEAVSKVDKTIEEFAVDFSDEAPYRYDDPPYSHVRFGLRSHSLAENVNVKLCAITPPPNDQYFRRNYPYQVQTHPPRQFDGNGCRINPGDRQLFEIVKAWMSGDGRLIIGGIDTQRSGNDGAFQMEHEEQWTMDYEITSANRRPQQLTFGARREGQSVVVVRLS